MFAIRCSNGVIFPGKDNRFIYYLKKDRIEKFLKQDSNICKSKELTDMDKISELLFLKDTNDTNILSNKMYHIKQIKNIEFIDTYVSFDENFCEE